MVDALIKDCGEGEKELAKKNIENAGEIIDLEKNIMKSNDEWVELEVAGDRLRKIPNEIIKKELKEKKKIKVRISKVILDTGEIEYLLTNVREDIIAPEEMKETYFKRWQIQQEYKKNNKIKT